MTKKKYHVFSFIITTCVAIVQVPSGFNTLKEAVNSANNYDIIQLLTGNFTID